MSWDLLQRFFDSEVFNQNPFLSVSYLTYACHPLRALSSSILSRAPPPSPLPPGRAPRCFIDVC